MRIWYFSLSYMIVNWSSVGNYIFLNFHLINIFAALTNTKCALIKKLQSLAASLTAAVKRQRVLRASMFTRYHIWKTELVTTKTFSSSGSWRHFPWCQVAGGTYTITSTFCQLAATCCSYTGEQAHIMSCKLHSCAVTCRSDTGAAERNPSASLIL